MGAIRFSDLKDYQDLGRALAVSNGRFEIVATLDVGPRIIRFALGDGANIFEDRAPADGGARRRHLAHLRGTPRLAQPGGLPQELLAGQHAGRRMRKAGRRPDPAPGGGALDPHPQGAGGAPPGGPGARGQHPGQPGCLADRAGRVVVDRGCQGRAGGDPRRAAEHRPAAQPLRRPVAGFPHERQAGLLGRALHRGRQRHRRQDGVQAGRAQRVRLGCVLQPRVVLHQQVRAPAGRRLPRRRVQLGDVYSGLGGGAGVSLAADLAQARAVGVARR